MFLLPFSCKRYFSVRANFFFYGFATLDWFLCTPCLYIARTMIGSRRSYDLRKTIIADPSPNQFTLFYRHIVTSPQGNIFTRLYRFISAFWSWHIDTFFRYRWRTYCSIHYSGCWSTYSFWYCCAVGLNHLSWHVFANFSFDNLALFSIHVFANPSGNLPTHFFGLFNYFYIVVEIQDLYQI